MKKAVLYILSIIFSFSVSNDTEAQNIWTTFQKKDGLPSNKILRVYAETPTKIWLVSDSGLSLIQGQNISNYTYNSTIIPPDQIIDIEVAYNKLWMATGNGLNTFDGNNFQYNVNANNFASNNIKALTKTSNGELWIGSTAEAVRYNGTSYSYFLGIAASYLFTDPNDIVYANQHPSIINYPPSTQSLKYFQNGSWNTYTNLPNNFIYALTEIHEGNDRLIIRDGKTISELSLSGMNRLFDINEPTGSQVNPTSFTMKDSLIYSYLARTLVNGVDSNLTKVQLDRLMKYDSSFGGRISIQEIRFIYDMINDGSQIYMASDNGLYIGEMKLREQISSGVKLETNTIRTEVHPDQALFGMPTNRANFEFPKDSNSFGVYSSKLILVGSSPQLSGLRINTDQPWTGDHNLGPYGGSSLYNLRNLHKISKLEIQNHKNNYQNSSYTVPKNIADWPSNHDSTISIHTDLAPFFDSNNNGCYDPENGDYPIIKGDEAIYWITHTPLAEMPFEYHHMLYAYNSAVPELNNCQFMEIRVINRGSNNFNHIDAGVYYDGDLGYPADDYVGTDSINGISYFYNGDSFDNDFNGTNGFGQNSPALGLKLLSDSMIGSVYYTIGGGLNGDPVSILHWKNYLTGKWQDGSAMKYGGNGLNSPGVTTTSTHFMFTGDPLTGSGWTEKSRVGTNPNSPGDRRLLSVMKPFSLNAGSSKTISFVFGYGRKATVVHHDENIGEMVHILATAQAYWDTLSNPTINFGQNFNCSITVGEEEEISAELASKILIYPNPTNGLTILESDDKLDHLYLYSIAGQLVYEKAINNYSARVHLNNLKKGLYLLKIKTEDGKWLHEKLMIE